MVDQRNDSVANGLALVDALLAFGTNHLTVDYYFAILILMHTYSLNREELDRAAQVE